MKNQEEARELKERAMDKFFDEMEAVDISDVEVTILEPCS